MNSSVAIAQQKTCYKCGYEAETAELRCPRCRRKMKTKAETRVLGGVLAALGSLLIVIMGVIIIFMIGVMGQSGKTSGAKFTGTQGDGLLIFAILGTVMLFGFASLVAGFWQLIFARRNLVLIWVVLILGAILFIGGSIIRGILEK